jgi:hypothetical protein
VGSTGVSHVAHYRHRSSASCHVHAREQARLLVCYRYAQEGLPDAATALTLSKTHSSARSLEEVNRCNMEPAALSSAALVACCRACRLPSLDENGTKIEARVSEWLLDMEARAGELMGWGSGHGVGGSDDSLSLSGLDR